ncbi:hypothetical protein ACPYO6_08220 [Georgenia sp. Z1344]|uniref:hypothetical protein n=1 Tax=Georgenia sp. Z1344 TaxID=3416706 RepID=UPI003CEFB9A0
MSSPSGVPPTPESAETPDETDGAPPRPDTGDATTAGATTPGATGTRAARTGATSAGRARRSRPYRRRTRLPQHAWAVVFAILLVPGTVGVLAVLPWASDRVVAASGTGTALGPTAALLGLTLAALTLSWLVGWATAVFSSLTSWLYALGAWLVVSLSSDRLAQAEVAAPFRRAADGLRVLAEHGTATVAVVLVAGVAIGTSIARRNGRSDERAEATTGHERPRRGDHVLATAPAVALGALGAWLVALASPGVPDGNGWTSWLLLLGALVLAACAATAGISSIGGQIAGGLLVVLCLLHTSLLGTGPSPVELDPGQSSSALADGTLLVLGIVLAMGVSGAHWARRSGKRYERTEMAIAQVSRAARQARSRRV